MNQMRFCDSLYRYTRRKTRAVAVGDPARGGVIIGGDHPIVKQSMITADTADTEACARQTLELAAVGCELVRITVPTVSDAANLRAIAESVRRQGCLVPLVADVHFKPEAAFEAARWVEKVRINPGNYADSKKFAIKSYSDEQYATELARIEQKFAPLVDFCRQNRRAMRIGVNHGSLSDRIMNRYGDTPAGMVESAIEFAQIARKRGYHDIVFSMKSSNPKVTIACCRLLVARLEQLGEDWNYPVHLGVTEAGEGEDGRIKSAIGIGSLLCDGIGDTIRVSLTEDSTREIPVCRDLLAQIPALVNTAPVDELPAPFDPFSYERRLSSEVSLAPGVACGKQQPVRVIVTRQTWTKLGSNPEPSPGVRAEAVYEDLNVRELDPRRDFSIETETELVTVRDGLDIAPITAFRLLAARLAHQGKRNPILLKDCLGAPDTPLSSQAALLRSSVVLGALLADGIGDAILVRCETDPERSLRLAYNILQAAGCRFIKADYVACPSCGRTLFDLQSVIARIKARTAHLKGVRIAIMGCIVNGPGEMADADFGYVGGAPGKVNLYVGKKPVKFNIPETEAVDRLVDLIKEHGRWIDPSE